MNKVITLFFFQLFFSCLAMQLTAQQSGKEKHISIIMGLNAMETEETQYWEPAYSV